jgi:hypothetical protein
VWNGRIASDDVAVSNAIRSGRQWPSFDSLDEAEQAAVQRSADLGAGKERSIGGTSLPYDSREVDQGPHEAADNTSSALWPEAEAALPQSPGFLDRAKSNLNILGGQVSGFLNDYSLPHAIRDAAEQQQLEQEARANADPTDVAAQLLPGSPAERAWRQENPEKAARLDQLRESQMSLAGAGALRYDGRGRDGARCHRRHQAPQIPRTRRGGFPGYARDGAEVVHDARRDSSPSAWTGCRRGSRSYPNRRGCLPNEVPNPFPLTDEERALNAAADEKARSQPAHGGYLEDSDVSEIRKM